MKCSRLSRLRQISLPALLGVLAAGCEQTARDLSLDQEQARTACATVLEAWKAGKPPETLTPGITASDYAWTSGKQLLDFEFLPGEANDGTNLHIPVKLTLAGPSGKESTSNATYVVGTSPVITVIRD